MNFLKTLFILSFAFSMLSAMQLELKPQVEVSRSELLLSDVIQSMEDGKQEFWNLSLGMSPSLGTEKVFSQTTIERALRGRLSQLEISWVGPTSVKVIRPARTVMESELKSAMIQELEKLTGEPKTSLIQEISGFTPFKVPAGAVSFEMDFAPSTLQSAWSSVVLRVMSQGDTVLTKSIRFRWGWMRTAWIASQNLSHGEMVGPNFFKPVTLDVLQQPPGVYLGNSLPMESTLNRSMNAGKPLMANDFKPRVVVKRGTNVFVHYQMSGVQVSMQGVALEDGSRGSLINIQNPSSRRRLLARVVDEGNTVYAN